MYVDQELYKGVKRTVSWQSGLSAECTEVESDLLLVL